MTVQDDIQDLRDRVGRVEKLLILAIITNLPQLIKVLGEYLS